jgi:hypothetical protein
MTSTSVHPPGMPLPGRRLAAARAIRGLSLAAAPVFAAMAVIAAGHTDGSAGMCSAMQDPSPLGGMVPMYVLMSIFHVSPWLKLIARRYSGAGGGSPDRIGHSPADKRLETR